MGNTLLTRLFGKARATSAVVKLKPPERAALLDNFNRCLATLHAKLDASQKKSQQYLRKLNQYKLLKQARHADAVAATVARCQAFELWLIRQIDMFEGFVITVDQGEITESVLKGLTDISANLEQTITGLAGMQGMKAALQTFNDTLNKMDTVNALVEDTQDMMTDVQGIMPMDDDELEEQLVALDPPEYTDQPPKRKNSIRRNEPLRPPTSAQTPVGPPKSSTRHATLLNE